MNLRANSKLWLAGGIISILLVVGAYFASIAFAAGPDLTITSLTRNISDPSAFDLITYSVDLANIGDAVAGPSTLRLSIGNGAEVVDFAVPSISPATTFSYEHTTALPASAGYVDTATADLNGDVAEDDETNNVLAPGPYTVVPHQVYTVNSINDADDGTCNILHCSLREAINASNLKIGKDLIAFNIDGLGPHVIQPTSALPTLTDRTAIDGTTEPDFVLGLVTTPPIVLDGSSAGFGNTGLTIDAGLSHILGLFIHSFDGPGMWINDSPGTYVLDNVISGNGTYALNIEGANATGNIVQGNLIGTNVTGDAALPNGPGVRIANASNNTIGGSLASERNVISGNNTYGVAVSGVTSSDNTIQGNYIGIDVSGSSAIGNGSHGVWIIDAAQTNVIDNVVSGNDSVGVLIIDSATGTMVQGNFIGTDSTGSAALGNQFHGVSIQTGASNTTVGGAFASERNIISGNARSGVVVILSSSNNTIEGNYIGTDSTGALDLGNTELGVLIDGSPQNNVLDNVISGNDSHGIMVFRPGSTNNDIRGNLIGTNASGSGAVPNTGAGIYFQGGTTNNTVGGLLVSDRNLISGNLESGVHIDDNTTTGNTVRGNYIGTDSTGALDIGNGLRGVFLDNSPGNSILNNLISGNDDHGVFVFNFQASGNIVQGNMIGTTAAGNVALPNSSAGIYLRSGAFNNTIGGTVDSERNVISGNGDAGVLIDGSTTNGNTVRGNYIGTDLTGALDVGNSTHGVWITDSPSNSVLSNVISGNNNGIRIYNVSATGNIVQGNRIGTTAAGNVALPNSGAGIFVRGGASNNTIGGALASERNIISGNTLEGVRIDGPTTTGNTVRGNYIGTDSTGALDIGNSTHGVWITDSPSNSLLSNVMSGNENNGIRIFNVNATGNIVRGNMIGTTAPGNVALPNAGAGVFIRGGATNNTIGGTLASERNIISGNAAEGVRIEDLATADNTIQGNYIGTDSTGALDLGNTSYGVWINNSPGNDVLSNVISGNNSNGVRISGPNSTSNDVFSNRIGTNDAETSAVANTRSGIRVDGGASNIRIGETEGSGNTISGNTLHGVLIADAATFGITLKANRIGATRIGVPSIPNGAAGVRIEQASSVTIGTGTLGGRNVISGNTTIGVIISGSLASNNLLMGNHIGTDFPGTSAIPNGAHGVVIDGAPNNQIGSTSGQKNVISGNNIDGIRIQNVGADGNTIVGNLIGTNAPSASALPNLGSGVSILSAPNTTIGGDSQDSRNIISGNAGVGVWISGSAATGNHLLGNYIGLDISGLVAVGNTLSGILIESDASNNLIGNGVCPPIIDSLGTICNVVSANGQDGIYLASSAVSGNVVTGNAIGTNGELEAGDPVGNTINGIRILNSPNNSIGVSYGINSNVIAGNGGPGISVEGAGSTGNTMRGNFIGVDLSGEDSLPNAIGVSITGNASNNTIGGLASSDRNLISGNTGDGVFIGSGANNNSVHGNYIGTDAFGSDEAGNGGNGVQILGGNSNSIGSSLLGGANIIADNDGSGVIITANDAPGNVVDGNHIGLNLTGAPMGNGGDGVSIIRSSGNTIGSTGVGNIISSNGVVGVRIEGTIGTDATANVVQSNLIGTDNSGNNPSPNGNNGVLILNAVGNTIGGSSPDARNVISGNGNGIVIDGNLASGNLAQGNYVGTDITGALDLGNRFTGIAIRNGANNNIIGGSTPATRNIVSGNDQHGIVLFGLAGPSPTTANQIKGNFIGMDATGGFTLGNGQSGILITANSPNNFIGGNVGATLGGPCTDECNLISANGENGIYITFDAQADGNDIKGNMIGTNADGNRAFGNLQAGIKIEGNVSNTAIGGTAAGDGNTIAFNGRKGVVILGVGAANNSIQGNLFNANNNIGIDLGDDGATPNDLNDLDTGHNNLQNFPVLTSVTVGGGGTTIEGTLDSTPNIQHRIEFFSNEQCDTSGFGEGQHLLGDVTVLTNPAGQAAFTQFISTVPIGNLITSTATDVNGSTSEFSACFVLTSGVSNVSLSVNKSSVSAGSAAIEIKDIPVESVLKLPGLLSSTPFSAIDIQNSPFSAIPFSAIPFSAIEIDGAPFSAIPLSSIPFSAIGGWGSVLQGTGLEDAPLQTVTLEDVLALDPRPQAIADITLGEIDLSATPLRSLSLASILLGGIPFSAIPFSAISADTGTASLMELEANGKTIDTSPFSAIPFSAIPFSAIPFSAISVSGTPFSAIQLSDVPAPGATGDLCDYLGQFDDYACGDLGLSSASTIEQLLLAIAADPRLDINASPLTAVPFSAIPFSAIPFSSIPFSAIPFSAIPYSVMTDPDTALSNVSLRAMILPGLALNMCDFLLDYPGLTCDDLDLTLDSTFNQMVNAILDQGVSLESSPFSAIPFSAIPFSAIPFSAIPFSAIPFSAIDMANTPFSAIPFSAINPPDGTSNLCEFMLAYPGYTCGELGFELDTTLGEAFTAIEADPTLNLFASPFSAIPFSAIPFSAIPFSAIPFSAIPFSAIDLDSVPFSAIPFSAIAVADTPFSAIPFSAIDLPGDFADPCDFLEQGNSNLNCAALGIDATDTIQDVVMAIIASGTTLESSPFSALPFSAIPFSAIPFSAIPFSAIPFSAIDFSSAPFSAIPFSAIDIADTPFSAITLDEVINPDTSQTLCQHMQGSAFECGALGLDGNSPLGQLLVAIEDSGSPLSATPLADLPFSAIPFSAIDLDTVPLSVIPFSAIPFSAIPFSAIDFSSAPFSAIPFSAIDLPRGFTDPCEFMANSGFGPLYTCEALGIDQTTDLQTIVGIINDDPSLDIISSPFSAIPFSVIPFSAIPFSAISLEDIPFSAITIDGTPFSAIPFSAIDVANTPFSAIKLDDIPFSAIDVGASPFSAIPFSAIPFSAINTIVDCTQIGCTLGDNHTLGDAGDVGAIRAEATFGDLAGLLDEQTLDKLSLADLRVYGDVTVQDILDAVPGEVDFMLSFIFGDVTFGEARDDPDTDFGTLTFNDMLNAVLAKSDVAWEEVPLDDLRSKGLVGGENLQYAVGFSTGVTPLGDVVATVDLPEGYQYVSGSSVLSVTVPGYDSGVLYDFNNLSGNDTDPFGTLAGQDNWTTQALEFNTPTARRSVGVTASQGFDGTQSLKYTDGGGGIGTDASRLNDGSFSLPTYSGSETSAFFQIDVDPAFWGGTFAMGHDIVDGAIRGATPDEIGPRILWGTNNAIGIGIVPAGGGADTRVHLSEVGGDGWLRLRLVMDFTANGGQGSGSMFYQNLSLGDTSLQPVSGLQNVNLGLTPGAPDGHDPANWNGMFLHFEGAIHQMDNVFAGTQIESVETVAPLADPTINDLQLIWDVDPVVSAGADATLEFQARPSFRLGSYTASASISGGGTSESVSGQASVTSTEHFEPQNNDPTTAPIADPNTLYVTHISNSTDVDFYRIAVPPDPGTRVSVFLSHLTVDEDLVMYRPQTALLSSADPSRETLGSAPIEDTGIDLNNDSGQLAPETLQDIRSESLPLVSLSTNRDTSDETVETLSRGESGFYTIQVSGYNGAFSDDPYVLRVKVSAPPPPPSCKPRRFEFDGQGVPGSLPSIGSDVNTLFLVNQEQLGNLYGPAEAGLVMAALNDLASRSAIGVTGAVIPVEGDLSVRSAYQAWNTNPCSPDEANDIVSAIIALVNDLRIDSGTGDALLPDLKYVVMVGSDEAIPMARVPDLTRLSNQRDYAQDLEFAGNGALFGSYITENILTDDPYGDFDPIPWLDRQLFVPDVAMGRMVETPQEIIDAVDQYIRFNGALDPQTAVTSGYDFLTDGAEQVDEILAEQLGAANTNTLINETWTASDLIDLIGPSAGSTAPDIASVNAHFDHYRALPADQNAAGTQNELFNTQHVSAFPTGSLEGNILFSMGCQAGLSVSDVLIGSPTSQQAERLLDWPQAYAQQGALYAANTGFGYGDTEVVALSERLMALFSQNLNGSMTVGQALTFAKQNYYASLGVYGVYDEKVLVEATFYGLPMYTVGSTVNPPPPPEPLPLEIDPITGLQSSTIHTEPNFELVDGVNGDFYQIEGQTQVTHYRPIQPRDEFEVTQPTAVAHGAIITSLTSVDELGFDVAFARPIIDQTDNEPVPEFGSVAFPTVFQNVNTYNDVNGEQQRLVILPGQFFRDDNGMGVQRRFLSLDARVYYSDDDDDFVAPTLHRIGAEVIGSNAKFVVNATDDSPTTVVRVLVLFRDESGLWSSLDLTEEGDTDIWSGLSPVIGSRIEYLVQAVDHAGNVAVSTKKGNYYEAIPPTVDAGHDQTTVEGSAVDIEVLFTGMDVLDTVTATIDWDDGSPVETQTPDQAAGSGTVAANHVYNVSGDYNVHVCITGGTSQVCDILNVTVEAQPPIIVLEGDDDAIEGNEYTLTIVDQSDEPDDPDTSFVIDWGDGSFETTDSPGEVTHEYEDGPAEFTITVDLVDEHGDVVETSTGQVEINNAPPEITLSGPSSVDEGAVYSLTLGVVTDPGDDSVNQYVVRWGDGDDDIVTSPGVLTHVYDDGPISRTISVNLEDEDGVYLDAETLFLAVNDVPPTVGLSGASTVNEGATYTLTIGEMTDPGDDTITELIVNWGDGDSESFAQPGNYTHVYTDGPAEIAITVDLVNEDDTYSDAGSLAVGVANVSPILTLDTSGKVLFPSGNEATIGKKSVTQTHSASATDPGADDLTFEWSFGLSTTYPSNGAAPASASDIAGVTFDTAGVHIVEVTILDDDDDSDRDGLTAIIVDDCDCVEGLGFWKKEFKGRSEKDAKKVEKGQLIDEPTLAAYLDIIRFASSHFDENVPLTTFVDASRVLNPEKHRDTGPGSNNKGGSKEGTNPSATGSRKKKSGDTNHDESDSNTGTGKNIAKKREDALKHTLSAWLNFAKGAVDWDEDIVVEGGTGTGTRAKPVVAMPFNEVIAEVEAILNNPDAAHDDLVHAKNLAESINKHDDGNKDCGTDSGSGSGTASRESKSEDDIKGSDSGSQKRGKKKDK